MSFPWRRTSAGAALLCSLAMAGYAGAQQAAKSLQESKLTLEEAHALLTRSGPGTVLEVYANGVGGLVASPATTGRRTEFELRGRFADARGGTFVMQVRFTGDPFPIRWVEEGNYGRVLFPDAWIRFDHWHTARRLAEALQALREYAAMGQFLGEAAAPDNFAQIAAQYLAANPRPAVTEEMRKLKVQADFAAGKKLYAQAIDRYEEVLRAAPWWADAHFNRALMLGEAGRYAEAASQMGKYLALEPNAKDARAAQDRQYQWEGEARMAKIQIKTEGRAP